MLPAGWVVIVGLDHGVVWKALRIIAMVRVGRLPGATFGQQVVPTSSQGVGG